MDQEPLQVNRFHILSCSKTIQITLIITLSFGSMETDSVISESCYNEVIYNTYSKIINLGAMTWPHYTENFTIVRRVIMRLNCTMNLCQS